VGDTRNTIEICLENLKGIEHSKDLGVDLRIIVGWIDDKYCEKVWTGCNWLRTGTNAELL
jgi:hypothetical protein